MKAGILGENVRLLRQERNMTQADLARITGINEKYISALERGERGVKNGIGRKNIEKLCEAFGVDELTLRYGEREDPKNVDRDLLELQGEIERAFTAAKASSLTEKHEFIVRVLRAAKAPAEERA